MDDLKPAIKALEKKEFACHADAEKEYARSMADGKWALFKNAYEITETVREKWPPGRRGAGTRPALAPSYRIRITQVDQKEEECRKYLQNESCIVLVSNVTDEAVTDRRLIETYKGQHVVENSFRQLKGPNLADAIYLKNPYRIRALTMILSIALLLRALIQYRLRDGLRKHDEENPGVPIMAGWGGKPLKNPTYKLFYEHCINCHYKREGRGKYSFAWPFVETRHVVESLLSLMGLTVKTVMG
jgi:transposase